MLTSLPIFSGTGLEEWMLWGLIAISYGTSMLTAAFGIGGGIALLAVMSMVMPVASVIPVHGVVQMGSNAGRAYHLRAHIKWPILLAFAIGALLGTAVGSQLVVALPDALLKILLSGFVLFLVWGPKPKSIGSGNMALAIGGAASSLFTMFVGATGPLVAAIIAGRAKDRQSIVATHASAMTIQHGLKIIAFGLIGFAFEEWAALIIAMIASGYLGTITGSHVLKRMDEVLFRRIFKAILTLLAVFMLLKALRDLL